MSPFWILLELRVTEVVVTTGAIRRAKLQSNRHHQQANTQFFYRPDALPVARPTMSNHRREKARWYTAMLEKEVLLMAHRYPRYLHTSASGGWTMSRSEGPTRCWRAFCSIMRKLTMMLGRGSGLGSRSTQSPLTSRCYHHRCSASLQLYACHRSRCVTSHRRWPWSLINHTADCIHVPVVYYYVRN